MTITFSVSDVATCEKPRQTVSVDRRLHDLGWSDLEAAHHDADDVVDGPLVHPLVLAVDLAFAEHRPLRLRPDVVWACLAQGLATHVDLHASELRPRLFHSTLAPAEEPITLEVRRDDFVPRSSTNDWPSVVSELTSMIRAHLGGRADLFLPNFSTTTALDRTVSSVALMGAMRQYFRYSVATLCGIPRITLIGAPRDWRSIRAKVAAFRELDLGWWADALDPVLEEIEATSSGRVNREFWRRMYKMEHESGGDRSSGWFSTLFPYMEDPPTRSRFPAVNPDGTCEPFEGYKLSDFPSGRARAPFTWRFQHESVAMEIVSGLFGVTADEDGVLDVASGWLVSGARQDSGWVRSQGSSRSASTLTLTPGPSLAQTMTDLSSLRLEAPGASNEPRAVVLRSADQLRRLDGVAHLRGLTELSVTGPLLEDASALHGQEALEWLDLGNCPNLVGLGPVLATLPRLRGLVLMNDKKLGPEDFAPIAAMERLEWLVLWSCDVPEPIRCATHGLEKVRAARELLRSVTNRA